MRAWSNLPNAQLIDWVIASIDAGMTGWKPTKARSLIRIKAWQTACDQGRNTIWYTCRDTLQKVGEEHPGWFGAWNAVAALVAYDDCDQYLSMTHEELRVWAVLSEAPQAILLLPMKQAQEHECMVAPT